MSFNTPIILKDTSSLYNRRDSLKASLKNNNYDGVYNYEMGIAGEEQVLYHLKKSNIGMYVLRDINLAVDGMTAQIDFVVVTSHHCYFIESKNYKANKIIVDENRNFEISMKYRNRYQRSGIKSPLSQADDQLSVLKRVCLKNEEQSKQLFKNTRFNDYFKTMVAFTNEENKLDLRKAPSDIKYRILKVDNLIRQIEYDDKHFNGTKLSQDEMKAIADFILSNHIEPKIEDIKPDIEFVDEEKNNTIWVKEINNRWLGPVITVIVLLLFFMYLFWTYYSNKKYTPTFKYNTNNQVTSPTNNMNDKSYTLTDAQVDALNKLKVAYNNSKKDGFDIIHGDTCNTLSSIFGNKGFTCGQYPLEVNYKSDNNITIYKDWNCYSLTIEDNRVISSDIENLIMTGNKTCTGIPVGYTHIDENNDYCKKIGGFEKIRKMAIDTYNNKSVPSNYFDYNHIKERGGSSTLASIYNVYINQYMCGVTGRGNSGCTFVGKEDSDKMCEYYYYVTK